MPTWLPVSSASVGVVLSFLSTFSSLPACMVSLPSTWAFRAALVWAVILVFLPIYTLALLVVFSITTVPDRLTGSSAAFLSAALASLVSLASLASLVSLAALVSFLSDLSATLLSFLVSALAVLSPTLASFTSLASFAASFFSASLVEAAAWAAISSWLAICASRVAVPFLASTASCLVCPPANTTAASLCTFLMPTAAPAPSLVSLLVFTTVLLILILLFTMSISALAFTLPSRATSLPSLPMVTVALLSRLVTDTAAPISTYWFQAAFFWVLSDFGAIVALSVAAVPLAAFTASLSPLVAAFLASAFLLPPRMPPAISPDLVSRPISSDRPSAAELSPSAAGGAASRSITFSGTVDSVLEDLASALVSFLTASLDLAAASCFASALASAFLSSFLASAAFSKPLLVLISSLLYLLWASVVTFLPSTLVFTFTSALVRVPTMFTAVEATALLSTAV